MTKTKPTKHKEDNTFKFQTFAERLSAVNVDVVHSLSLKRNQVPEETETFFYECLEKWSDLNCTEGYANLCSGLGRDVQSLAQLLLHQERITDHLLEHVTKENTLFLEPLLELIVAVARDLQADFYTSFKQLFPKLITLLQTRDPQIIEHSFTTLAHLYKHLWRSMVRDVGTVYDLQQPLLSANQPEHIRLFASESFAFIARKVPDKPGFLQLIFDRLSVNPSDCPGVGQLLFQIIKGVQNQFHSVLDAYFPLFLKSVATMGSAAKVDPVFKAIETSLILMARHTTAQHCRRVWDLFLESIAANKNIALLLLLDQWVTFKEGSLVSDRATSIIRALSSLLRAGLVNEEQQVVASTVARLLVSPKVDVVLDDVNAVSKLIYSQNCHLSAVLSFSTAVANHRFFESHLLPQYLSFCHRAVVDGNRLDQDLVLDSLARLIVGKTRLPVNGDQVSSYRIYPLEFSFALRKEGSAGERGIPGLIADLLAEDVSAFLDQDFQRFILALVCLPHVRPLDASATSATMKRIIGRIGELVGDGADEPEPKRRKVAAESVRRVDRIDRLGLVASLCVLNLSRAASSPDAALAVLPWPELAALVNEETRTDVFFLRAIDFHVTLALQSGHQEALPELPELFALLGSNLASPHREVRLLTLHALSQLPAPLPPCPENVTPTPVFVTCLRAESLTAGLRDHREKIKFLQNLESGRVAYSLPLGDQFATVPLRYLLSQLFVNFRPLWDPVMKLIESYASAMEPARFWGVYFEFMRRVRDGAWVGDGSADPIGPRLDFLKLAVGAERLDLANVRCLLWQALSRFGDAAEKQHAVVVPMFLDFWNAEYRTSDMAAAPSQDLTLGAPAGSDGVGLGEGAKKESVEPESGGVDDGDKSMVAESGEPESGYFIDGDESFALVAEPIDELDADGDVDGDETVAPAPETGDALDMANEGGDSILVAEAGGAVNPSAPEPESDKAERKKMMNLLTAHLTLLATFKRPRYVTREPELTAIIMHLLSHRAPHVQKLSLDCLCAYGYSYLTSYRENLNRLLDDKTFRSELTVFSLDSENSLVRPEHRQGLTPVLLRLLFGRMQSKAGAKQTGKQANLHRQGLILRYLAGFSDAEVDVFLDLAFQLFRSGDSAGDSESGLYGRIMAVVDTADPASALPLKRLQGALSLMATMFSKLGNLMTSTLPKLLAILLTVCGHVTGLLERRERIAAKHWSQLRNLRNVCLERVAQFFSKFQRYPWSPMELEAVFHACVWPQAHLLAVEAIHTPTPLLRLFQVWAENPRYFVLFGKLRPGSQEGLLTPLMALLTGGKARPAVCSFIMDLVEKLVTLADYGTGEVDEETEVPEEPVFIEPEHCVDWKARAVAKEANIGSKLLIPHVPKILAYLRTVVSKGLSSRDLNVLMRVSEFITDTNVSSELARLLVPAVKAAAVRHRNNPAQEQVLEQYLSSLANLLLTANNPRGFLGLLAPLFGSVAGRSARDALCGAVGVIGRRDPQQAHLADMVCALNSWDERRVDQADFDRRLSAHKDINVRLQTATDAPAVDWMALVLYNCFHFVRTADDSSLRDSASFTLQQISVALGRLKYGRIVLNTHFLPQVRSLLRSSNETVRHEGVTILAEAVVHCGALNGSLSSLRKLRKSGDVELDFFENSRHLQTHRRSRALLRLAGFLKSDRSSISGETLTQFLLPLTTCYLFDSGYDKHNHLVDAALDCLQAVARCLSWYDYDKLLRFYLINMTKQVEFQKQAVKAVVAVLNGFHFDLRKSTFKGGFRKDPSGELVPMEQQEEEPSQSAQQPEQQEECDLSVQEATKIHSVIAQQLLPQLNKILTARSKRDMQHKAVKDHFPEDDEILRVPIALALVTLLKNLPPGALERNLPGMFSKVCTFLKSRCDSVRETARDTLIRMMTTLGPVHLSAMLSATEPILQRGFQVHVYIYTVHAVLVKMVELGQIQHGSLDAVVHPLVEICKKELLGDTAEEKEVAQIAGKLKEARGIKSYDTLNIISKYVSQCGLLPLILPLKEILASTRSFKMLRKVEECLQNVATGLSFNTGISVDSLLVFSHGVMSLTIPQLKLAAPRNPLDGAHANAAGSKGHPGRADSLIIEAEPKRKSAAQPVTSKAASKSAYVTNSHLLVEFGLLTLNLLLKNEKCHERSGASQVLSMLDPLIPILNDCLNDPNAKVVALSLRCICRLLRAPLPSIGQYAPKISSSIFGLLHKYAGNACGDNFEMIQTAFKAVTVLLRYVTSHLIDADQLRVLLTYAEQALCDPTQQSIGFGVLQAVLRRKLAPEELPEVMMRVAQLSVTSESVPVRAQCKQVVLKYMIDYPLGKKLLKYLEFFLGQLEYEKEVGRLSVIEFMADMFNAFPKNLLSQQSTLFLVTLSPRLINETSANCVKAVAAALRILIQRLNTNTSSTLFEICITWLTGENACHRRLAAQLCGIFAAAEGAKFEFRVKQLLPHMIRLLQASDFDKEDRDADLLVIQILYCVAKISQHCPGGLRNADLADTTDELWNCIVNHLQHPHVWIRTLSARAVGTVLGWHKAEQVAAHIASPADDSVRTYLTCPEAASRLRSLASESIAQLQSSLLDQQLADQVVKNMVFIAKVAIRIPDAGEQASELATAPPSLPWLTGKLRREIHAEVALRPKIPIKRVSVFKWMAAVAVDLHHFGGKEGVESMLKFFVPPLTREMNDDGAPDEVRQLSQEVADLIKGIVGTETYSAAVVAASKNLAVRRRDRQSQRKADSVVNPDKTAKVRIKKHLAKRVAKKVKIAKLKGRRPKLKDMAFSS